MSHRTILPCLALAIVATGGATCAQSPPPGASRRAAPAVVPLPTDPAATIAVVGRSPILWGEIEPQVSARIAEVVRQKGPVPKEQIAMARVGLSRSLLASNIRNKMMREAFLLGQLGTAPDKERGEADAKLTARARQMFRENEVPQLHEQYGTEDLADLDAALRKKGASLARRQRDFVDMMLGHLYIRDAVAKDPDVPVADVVSYYRSHRSDYERPDRARFEQLSAYDDRSGGRTAAKRLIAEMGREAYFGGNLQAVARSKSHEPLASAGGLHDWTRRGSLASEAIDDALFTLPLNQMSDIIEDANGCHIIRVLERTEAGVVPLAEVQDEIRSKLQKRIVQEQQREALESLTVRIPVWSWFPDDVPGSMPLPGSVASRRGTSPPRDRR